MALRPEDPIFLPGEKKSGLLETSGKTMIHLMGLNPLIFHLSRSNYRGCFYVPAWEPKHQFLLGVGGGAPEGLATKSATAVHGKEVRIHTPYPCSGC